MKKNTQAAVLSVKMNDQFQINEAVNYWNEHRSWAWIFSVLDLAYRTEPTDEGGTRFIVHNKYDPENVYAVAEEYASGTAGEIVIISKRMLGQPDLVGVSMGMHQFFSFFFFPGDYEKMLKKEIIPFYEMHLRDLAAEESIEAKKKAETENDLADLAAEDEDDTTEDTTTKKGATTMKTQELQVIDRTNGDAHIVTETAIIHDLVEGKPSIISYDGDIQSTLEEMVGPLPEDHSHLPEEYAYFWNWCNDDKGTIDGFEKALGIRIEYFEDFLRENSEEWTDNGIEVKEPNWRYPEDCISETTKK